MEVPDISKLIDSRTAQIWDEVNQHYKVTLEFHDENCYSCKYNYNEKHVTSYIARNNYNLNYFAHEILHFFIRIKGLDIGTFLISLFTLNDKLLYILDECQLHRIINSLEHFKMLPIYLELGFDRSQFTINYSDLKFDNWAATSMLANLSDNSVASRKTAGDFIEVFFVMKANPNPSIDYTEQLEYLNMADKSLYEILDRFWNDWVSLMEGSVIAIYLL